MSDDDELYDDAPTETEAEPDVAELLASGRGGGGAPKGGVDIGTALAGAQMLSQVRASAAPAEVPSEPATLTDAFKTGALTYRSHDRVPVRLANGEIGTVPATELQGVVDSGGSIVPHDEYRAAELDEKYGGLGGSLAAGGAAFARGATAGLSDPLAVGVAGLAGGQGTANNVRTWLAEQREAHPYLSTAGELAGAVAPALLSGGASAGITAAEEGAAGARALGAIGGAAREGVAALGLPSRGIGAAGQAVGGLVRGAIGTGEGAGLASRVGRAILSHGATGATEGALFGIGNEISEATLGDHELNAEKLLSGAGHGALVGFGLGGALGATGELSREVVGRMAPSLRAKAEGEAFRAINARKAFVEQIEKVPGGKHAAGRLLRDEGLVQFGDNVQQIAPRISAARQRVGDEIGEMLTKADASGAQGPSIAAIRESVEKGVIADLEKLGETNAGAIMKARSLLADLESNLPELEGTGTRTTRKLTESEQRALMKRWPLSPEQLESEGFTYDSRGNILRVETTPNLRSDTLGFRQAQQLRAKIDDLIKWNSSPLAPVNETTVAMKAVRNAVENEIVSAGERAAPKIGSDFRSAYEAAKLKYRQLAILDKAATDSVSRAGANAEHSLTDKIMGAAGLHAGLGHGPLGLLLGPAFAAASKAIRTRGNASASAIYDKIASLSSVEQAAARVDRQIDRAVAGLLEPGTRVDPKLRQTSAVKGESLAQGYQRRVDSVARAASDVDAHAETVSASLAKIAPHAPNVADAYQHRALLATQYLASKIPQAHRGMSADDLNAKFEKPRVSDSEMAQFNQLFDVVDDPPKLLAYANQGRVTPQMVDALEATKPKLLDEMREKLRTSVANSKKPIPYQKRIAIAQVLGTKGEPTLQPSFVSGCQTTFATGAGKGQPDMPSFDSPPSATPRKPLSNPSPDMSAAAFSLSKTGYGSR